MRVLITDGPVLMAGKKSGVGHYTCELIRGLRRVAGDDLVHSWAPSRWLTVRQNWLNRQSARYESVAARPGRLAWAEMKVRGKMLALVRKAFPSMGHPYRAAAQRAGCTLYHEPNFIPLTLDVPTVVSVHDLSALRFPEWHPPARVAAFERHFHRGLKDATRLIAISEFGKQEIVRHLGWPADKVSVTYMGVRPELHPATGDELRRGLKALDLAPGYLLHVGTVEPRKNLPMLLRAYAGLPAAVRERHPLVLVGGRGWHSEPIHDYVRAEGRAKNVRWLGYTDDAHFSALYSGARAFVFPTFYEGFGMPTIEAMACGTPVLASTAGAVAETAGPRAHLIDPQDQDGWRDAMLRVCTDDDWHAQLSEGIGEHAAQYTWDRCARETLEAYHLTAGLPEMPARKAA